MEEKNHSRKKRIFYFVKMGFSYVILIGKRSGHESPQRLNPSSLADSNLILKGPWKHGCCCSLETRALSTEGFCPRPVSLLSLFFILSLPAAPKLHFQRNRSKYIMQVIHFYMMLPLLTPQPTPASLGRKTFSCGCHFLNGSSQQTTYTHPPALSKYSY